MVEKHPIEELMKTAMHSIKEMIDVNTVVGNTVQTPDGKVIIPISKVACGFAAGGSEFDMPSNGEAEMLPFGGGSGAGVSVQPVGFLVVSNQEVRFLAVDGSAMVDRLIDLAPQMLEKLKNLCNSEKHANENRCESEVNL